MDVEVNIARIRELYRAILDDSLRSSEKLDAADDLAASVQSLDEWLSAGGFPPQDWQVKIHDVGGYGAAGPPRPLPKGRRAQRALARQNEKRL